MANTYTQLHIQYVFAVQNRMSLIHPSWEEELFKYFSGIARNQKHKLIAVNGMPDHIHLFVGMHPGQSISNFIQIAKGESSQWINDKKFVNGKFRWQEGYGAFSYGHSQISQVYNYIMRQKEHHQKSTFLSEYKQLLRKFDISFDERYIFRPIE